MNECVWIWYFLIIFSKYSLIHVGRKERRVRGGWMDVELFLTSPCKVIHFFFLMFIIIYHYLLLLLFIIKHYYISHLRNLFPVCVFMCFIFYFIAGSWLKVGTQSFFSFFLTYYKYQLSSTTILFSILVKLRHRACVTVTVYRINNLRASYSPDFGVYGEWFLTCNLLFLLHLK